ncbi:MAG: cupin domain-containing protein [Anaerolineae bacterium]|nr:cupin domain-containing protein [Anaerolineae bacterium]
MKKRNALVVIDANQVQPFWSAPPNRRELRVLLSPKIHDTSPDLAVGLVTIPPGESGNSHFHAAEQETWYVLSGFGKLVIGDERVDLKPDMVVVAPVGVTHQIINDGKEILKALFIFSPAGPEEEFIVECDYVKR